MVALPNETVKSLSLYTNAVSTLSFSVVCICVQCTRGHTDRTGSPESCTPHGGGGSYHSSPSAAHFRSDDVTEILYEYYTDAYTRIIIILVASTTCV